LRAGVVDLDEGAFADAGAVASGLAPFAAAVDELGPEGKDAALGGFDMVDRAAAFDKEVAGGRGGDAKAGAARSAVNVLALEGGGGHMEVRSDAEDVGVGEVDEAFLRAAGGASGLAFESEGLGHGDIVVVARRWRLPQNRRACRGVNFAPELQAKVTDVAAQQGRDLTDVVVLLRRGATLRARGHGQGGSAVDISPRANRSLYSGELM